MKKVKVFLIAGEVSGDKLGGKLMRSLKEQAIPLKIDLEFYGIGGREMIAEGLKLTHSMERIGLIGLFEIIPHLFRLFSIIKSTAKLIDELKPAVVITIDSWDFCSRIAARIKSRSSMKLVHYVSPTIWAYRKNRIQQIEKLYDLVLSIFPFEPKYYKKSNAACKYIGHPLTEIFSKTNKKNFFRTKYKLNHNTKILGVMAGSREGEIKKLLPIFIKAVDIFSSQLENKEKFLIVFPAVNNVIAKKLASFQSQMNFKNLILDMSKIKDDDRINILKGFDLALVKSGTGSLELTLAKVPMVVAYKINYCSELIAEYIFQLHKNLKYVSMTNIMLDEQVIKECLQRNCNSRAISNGLLQLLEPNYRKKQLLNYSKIVSMLSNERNKKPSDIAAVSVLKLIS